MFDVNKIVRPNIRALTPYSSARTEFLSTTETVLDANENPFGFGLNRYPDPLHIKLKRAFASFRNVNQNRLVFGNGSDELIDLLIRAFCEPSKDKILTFPPTFAIYETFANINNVEVLHAPLTKEFQIERDSLTPILLTKKLKIIFVCSPNNPTGNQMDLATIEDIARSFHGLVVVDEAYVDFSGGSLVHKELPNLFILQTFSKLLGLAGARLGIGIGNAQVISILNKIKPPYNINSLTQAKAVEVMTRPELLRKQVEILTRERENLKKELVSLPQVKKVYPSDANFLLVAFEDAKKTYKDLLEKGIVVRDRSNQIANALRITIGTPKENNQLIKALRGKNKDHKGRVGSCTRTTLETKIRVEVNLDDPSGSFSATGIQFFDHMLDQVARHGAIGLRVEAEGDLKIDPHHTIEDTALAFGIAFNEALGHSKEIERYGFLLPMDDCLAQVAIDLGGRPWFEWEVEFTAPHIGEMPTEMASHFFKSFSDKALCNLNIKAWGKNDHHKMESVFKAFARALKMAIQKDKRGIFPSTKGVL